MTKKMKIRIGIEKADCVVCRNEKGYLLLASRKWVCEGCLHNRIDKVREVRWRRNKVYLQKEDDLGVEYRRRVASRQQERLLRELETRHASPEYVI